VAGSVGPYGATLHDYSEYHGNYVEKMSIQVNIYFNTLTLSVENCDVLCVYVFRLRSWFNPWQGRPRYIWMYTPSAVSTFGWICALYKSYYFILFECVYTSQFICTKAFTDLPPLMSEQCHDRTALLRVTADYHFDTSIVSGYYTP
jgi:hypothetical protein